MYPILYESITLGTVPQHNGLGVLSDCISCYCEHARNDIYELTFEYPMSGIHAQDIAYMRFIKAKPNPTDDPQLFYIDRIGKVMNGKFTVYCKHISYLLSGYDIVSGTASTAAAACTLLQNASTGFTITTDKVISASFKINTPASVRSYFVGRQGSFLDVFGKADIKYNNFSVQFLTDAGADRGVTIRYAKNLLELSQEIDASNLYTHVRCFYQNNDTAAVVGDKVATGLSLGIDKVLVVDVSEEYQEAPTVSTLTTRAQKYINDNNLTTPTDNIKLDFVQSGELSNRVDLCDTVSVYYPALGITRTGVKCIRVKYDVIKGKYIETEFGDAQGSAVDTMVLTNALIAEKPSVSFMAEAIAHATGLITGNLGGYVVLHDANGDGEPDEILIMDTADINTATKVWRWNKNGLGYSSTGYSGTFGTAITADGKIVADYVSTGTLDANLIKAGIISDTSNTFTLNMTSGEAVMKNLKAKLGLSLIDANNTTRAEFTYTARTGAAMFLRNSAGNATVGLVAGDGDNAGIWLGTETGRQALNIEVTDAGGQFMLTNSSNKNTVKLFASSAWSAGELQLANSDGTVHTELKRVVNGGDLTVYTNGGKSQVSVAASSGGGRITINNSSEVTKITANGNDGNITCVSLTQTSSRKVKKNIKPIEDAEKILKLQAVSFDYINEDEGKDRRGFIAEDVAEILPNLVTPETEEHNATLDYMQMIPYLQAVIKDQESRIQELERRLTALENKQA
jgi:phage minor structural protein